MEIKKYKSKPNSFVFLDTPCGQVKGLRKPDCLWFEGIPFAHAERFEDPVLVEGWEGTLDATRFGPCCSQHLQFYQNKDEWSKEFYFQQNAEKRIYEYDEDGLNLNIWVPEGIKDAPVAVFIHGGSFVSGSNTSQNICHGAEYCQRGIVYVAINYRLGAFANGYDDTHKGNYAIKDQVAALRWIKNNIAAFGGDPERITVIGESAGALSLQVLLYCPYVKDIIKGAVFMSGGGNFETLGTPCDPAITKKVWEMVMEKFGVDNLDQLKDRSAKEIYDAWGTAALSDLLLLNNCAKPIVDGDWIPGGFSQLADTDQILDVPCILGMSSQDMYPYYLYTFTTEWAAYHDTHGRHPVYAYYLDRQIPGGDDVGAYHGVDLWYAFGTLDFNWRPFEEVDYRISENMIDYFASFIKTGNPKVDGLATWEPMTKANTQFLRFGDALPQMYQPPVEQLKVDIRNTEKPFPGM